MTAKELENFEVALISTYFYATHHSAKEAGYIIETLKNRMI